MAGALSWPGRMVAATVGDQFGTVENLASSAADLNEEYPG
jgi:hypothetical protein